MMKESNMNELVELSTCEKIIMSILWSAKEDLDLTTVTAKALERFGKEWKLQTVATFMTRLEKKKYISIYKVGRFSHYHPEVKLEDYRKQQLEEMKGLLFFGGGYTQVERIQTMSEEELAEFLLYISFSYHWSEKEECIDWLRSRVDG